MRIRNAALALEARGEPVIRLEGGEPYPPTPENVVEALATAARDGKTRYPNSDGIAPLRKRLLERIIVKNAFTEVTLDSILVTCGAAQGLFAAFSAVIDPGDDVLLPSPFWTPIADMIALHGGHPVEASLLDAQGGDAVRAALEAALTPKTKVLFFNTPVNPSGRVFTSDEIEAVADFALEHDLVVISDEAYQDLVWGPHPHVSIGTLPEMCERTISVFTLSKTYAMTGFRVGWLVLPEPFRPAARRAVLYGSNGVPTPNQWAALAALDTPASLLDEWRRGYLTRRDALSDAIARAGFSRETPDGALYLFARLPESLGGGSERAAAELLDRAKISTVPGAAFGAAGEGRIRMSFSVPEERIARATEAFAALG
ncbi:MAG TPA: aminotransferase class I/II-fold pyridoxal phosphate-dependent enzyme [Thermoanaerobaculia bacterium]|nr:aminotransferase class I/II-fold pyridoxal phosphate-dependent enzyme [Thermoanaerobaculia bacterium]